MSLSRQQFLAAAAAVLAAPVLGTLGCGGEPGGACDAGAAASIGNNHDHAFTLSRTALEAGVAASFSIQGTAAHDHTIALGEQHLATLAAGGTVTLASSSGNGHTHPVTFSCA